MIYRSNFSSGIFLLFKVFFIVGVMVTSTLNAQIDQVEQALFSSLREKFEQARNNQVNFYAPQNFNSAIQMYESALADFKAEVRLSVIKEKINKANELLDRAINATRVSKVVLEELVKIRSRIHELAYNRYAPEEIARSERYFEQAILKAEEGDLRTSRTEADNVYQQYRLATIKWLNDSELKKAEENLKSLRASIEPRIYQRSLKELDNLKTQVERAKEEKFDLFRLKDDISEKAKGILEPFYPPFYKNLPDTLLIGEFVLIVDKYSNSGEWNFIQKQAVRLSGTAWTSFNCGLFAIPLAPYGYSKIKNVFKVVSVATDSSNQISLKEARLINPKIQLGQDLELELVVKQDDPYGILKAKKDLIAKLAPMPRKGDVLVHFDDVTIEPVTGRSHVGRIVQGIAAYPTQVPDPEIIKLNVAGFTALIDTLTLTTNLAKANIKLQFPDHVSSGTDCKPVSVSLGETTITSKCEFYVEKLNDTYGPFFIDDLGIKIIGKGYVADFSTTTTYSGATPPLPASWKGIRFGSGETIEQPEFNPCNTGYLYGRYSFDFLTINALGFSGELTLLAPWAFISLAPMNFYLSLQTGSLSLEESKVKDGKFSGRMQLPNDVLSPNHSPIVAIFSSLSVDKLLSLSGPVDINNELRWGGFGLKCKSGKFRLVAGPREFFEPVNQDSFRIAFFTPTTLDTLPGLTVKRQYSEDTLFVYSPDAKQPLAFSDYNGIYGWLNLEMQGISGYFYSQEKMVIMSVSLGDTGKTDYVAKSPFATTFAHSMMDSTWVKFWFAGNSVFDSDLRGNFDIAYPSGPLSLPFRNMGVTSTASFVGGNVAFKKMKTLGYWGVGFTSKRGVVSIKVGEIVYTNADIYEPVHFDTSFNIIWGEMLADGNLGEFYFNHNCAYQKFDGIPVTVDSAALSKYDPKLTGDLRGALVVHGGLHFNFFGEPDTMLTIYDTNYLQHQGKPYVGRLVTIDPHDFALHRHWGSELAYMDFDSVRYDSLDQNGFVGDGNVDLDFFKNSPLNASTVIDSSSITICISETNLHELQLPPADLTKLDHIWGCAYIEGDELTRMVIGGRVEKSAGGGFDIICPQAGVAVEAKMIVTPIITSFIVEGMVYLSIGPGNVEANARIALTCNRSIPSLEGDIQGKFNFDLLLSGGAKAEGQVNWHLEKAYHYLQGRVSVGICVWDLGAGFSAGAGLSGGIFVGMNAPSDRAWVLKDEDGKFGINMANLPGPLTGIYVFGNANFSVSVGFISGGVELYAGVGAFTNAIDGTSIPGPLPYLLGNVGIYIHGEILWGLVSAAAWGNLQLCGPIPFYFEGTFGLRGCVLWVFCASVEVTAGLSSQRGFYIE